MSSPHHCSDQFDMKNLTKTEILTQIHHTSIIINHVSQRFVHCRLHIFYYHCLKYIIITSVFLPVSRSLSEINPIWWKLCSFGDVVVITMSSTSLRPQLSAALSVDPIMTAGKNFYLGCWENKKQFYSVKKIHFYFLSRFAFFELRRIEVDFIFPQIFPYLALLNIWCTISKQNA